MKKNNNEIFKFKTKPKITFVCELRERDAGSGSSRAYVRMRHAAQCFFRRDYIKHHRRLYGKIEWFFLTLFYYLQLKFLLALFPSTLKRKKIMRAQLERIDIGRNASRHAIFSFAQFN